MFSETVVTVIHATTCIVSVRRLLRPSRLMHFGDVSETAGRKKLAWATWPETQRPKDYGKVMTTTMSARKPRKCGIRVGINRLLSITEIPVRNFRKFHVPNEAVHTGCTEPHPSHRAFGNCTRRRDIKERYWGQQFSQMERNISFRPTEMTGRTKYSGRTQSKWSVLFDF